MRSLRTPALAAAVVLLAACGGGDDDDASPSTTIEPVVVVADLDGMLLTLADLAPDDPLEAAWLEGKVDDGVDIQLPDCLIEDPGVEALGSAEATFVRDTPFKLPSLEQDLSQYADAAAAAEAFEVAADRLDGCVPEFVFEGTPSSGTIARLPLTLGGDESAAWRTTITIAETAISITSIHLVEGDLELSFVHVDAGIPDPAVLEGHVAMALAKLADT